MEDLRPDEELEAKEFEAATKSRWQRPSFPQLPKRPKLPRYKISELDWVLNKWVLGVVVILVLIFGGRWLHHVLKSDDTKTPVTTTIQTTTTNKAPAVATTPATTPTPSQTPNQVPNTGPGDTAAIFVAAVFVAGSAHYVITSRKSR